MEIINDQSLYTKSEITRKFPLSFIGVSKSPVEHIKYKILVVDDSYNVIVKHLKTLPESESVENIDILFGDSVGLKTVREAEDDTLYSSFKNTKYQNSVNYLLCEKVQKDGTDYLKVIAISDNLYELMHYSKLHNLTDRTQWIFIKGKANWSDVRYIGNSLSVSIDEYSRLQE